jgi:hypothetical protein
LPERGLQGSGLKFPSKPMGWGSAIPLQESPPWKIRVKKGPQMSSLQLRIAAFIDTNANLVTQLRELDRLREQVRKAEEFYHLAEQELRDADKSSPLRTPDNL